MGERIKRAILINDTSNEKHIGSSLVVNFIIQLCSKNGIKIIGRVTRKQLEYDSRIETLLNSKNVDLIIVNGEGSLHHCHLFFDKLLAILPNNKKCVLINSIWQDMVLENKDDLKKFDLISVRESKSHAEIKNIYDGELLIVPDLVFYYRPKRGLKSDYCYGDSVLTGLRYKLKKQVNYFPVNYDGSSPSIETYLKWLRTFKLHITGRFHGLCLSALANHPFLVFPSNSHKIEAILQDMNCSELLIKSFSDIPKKKELAYKLIERAHTYAVNAPKKIDKLFERIVKL